MQPNDLTDSSIVGQNRISSPQSQLPPTNYSPHSPVSVTIPYPKPNTYMLGQQRTVSMILEQPQKQQLQAYNGAGEDLHQVHTRQENSHCGFEKLVQRIQVAHSQSATTPLDSIWTNQLLASLPTSAHQCIQCRKAFISQYALHIHEPIRANHKLYAYAIRDARFTDGSNLDKHVRIVHNESEI
ncbi:hypothetical protein Aperf_G00000010766 [Anoplocephala perfoliata]